MKGMKTKTYIIIVTFIFCWSCKAQTPVVDLDANMMSVPNGAYYKDRLNELNKFVGTWQHTSGSVTFQITLQKKEMYFDGTDYLDILIGEFKYIENGVEIINTLNDLNNPNISGYEHNISGVLIKIPNLTVRCDDCNPNERLIKVFIKDPSRPYLDNHEIILRYLISSTPEQISVRINPTSSLFVPSDDAPIELSVPDGTYIMTKIN